MVLPHHTVAMKTARLCPYNPKDSHSPKGFLVQKLLFQGGGDLGLFRTDALLTWYGYFCISKKEKCI